MKNKEVALKFIEGENRLKGNNMFIEENVIYSYGHHFPMAVRLTDKFKVFGGNDKFVLNQNKYSVSTSRHQSYLVNQINEKDIILRTGEIQKFVGKKDVSEINYINLKIDNNLKIIENGGFKLGSLLKHKETGVVVEIKHIHKLYGWVTCLGLKQDWSNIGDFEVAYKEMIARAL